MTRFALVAFAVLMAVPAVAEPQKIMRPMPWSEQDGTCLQLACYAAKYLHEAYARGEIRGVRLNTRKECDALNFATFPEVPCTVLYPDEK